MKNEVAIAMKCAFGTLGGEMCASLHASDSSCFILAQANASFFIEKAF